MKNTYINFLKFAFACSDLLLVNLCLFVCYIIATTYYGSTTLNLVQVISFSSVLWVLGSYVFGLYKEYTLIRRKRVVRATLRNIVIYLLFFNLFYVLTHGISYSFFFLIIYSLMLPVCFSLSRFLYSIFETLLLRYSNPNKPVSILAIASIGGHWVQLLRLMPLFNDSNVTFVSTKANLRDSVDGHKFYSVPDANRRNKFKLIKCCVSIFTIIFFSKPEIIITTGAAPGLFGLMIGRLLGAKTIWVDSIANVEKLSLSGKIALKVADKVYTQWQHLSTPKIAFAGNILEA